MTRSIISRYVCSELINATIGGGEYYLHPKPIRKVQYQIPAARQCYKSVYPSSSRHPIDQKIWSQTESRNKRGKGGGEKKRPTHENASKIVHDGLSCSAFDHALPSKLEYWWQKS